MTTETPPARHELIGYPADETPAPIVIPLDVRNLPLTILAALAFVFLLRNGQELFIPIVLSILLAYALDPFVTVVERLHVPRTVATGVTIVGLLGSLCYASYGLRHQALDVIDSLPHAAAKVQEKIQEVGKNAAAPGPLNKIQQAAKAIQQTAEETAPAKTPTPGLTPVRVEEPLFRANDYLWAGSRGIIGLLGQSVLIFFLVFFLLASGDMFKRKLVQIIGRNFSDKRLTFDTLNEINAQIERFLLVQIATGAIVGICTGLTLWGMGLNQAIIWGIVAGVLNSVPYFGAIITVAGLGLTAFLQFDSISMALQVGGVVLLIHGLESFLLMPWLMSRVSRINGVAMFVSILFWSWLWGVIGMIVAVPITMVIKTICDRIEGLQIIGHLLDEA